MTKKGKLAGQISDAEEARIQRLISSDEEAPEITDEQIAQARPFTEAFPALAAKMRKNIGGRPRLTNPKVPISIRLDQDVIAKFKATGAGWQSRINEVLRGAKP